MKRTTAIAVLICLSLFDGHLNTAIADTTTNFWSVTFPFYANPGAGLVQGSDGNFYGTTCSGGGTNCPQGCGTVFRMSPCGELTNLYSFSGPDGADPLGGLVQGSDGNFYGTTCLGGNEVTNCPGGCGTVFRISPGGDLTDLYFFSGPDGLEPLAGLVQGSDGNFYGTTGFGGANGGGTVFRIGPGGSLTNLYSFTAGAAEYSPQAGLVQGSDGNFYGTALCSGQGYNGGVFKISPGGILTNLYVFKGSSDGAGPWGGLVLGTDGNFYGTTSSGAGTVFRITPAGTLTTLCTFNGANGKESLAGLVQGSDGNFYGTTCYGTNSAGNVFRVTPSGNLTNLYSFSSYDGFAPTAAPVQGIDGSFYGTTDLGGLGALGSVYKLTVALSPAPNQINALALTGADVIVTVASVAYETYQLQVCSSLDTGTWCNVAGASVTNSIGSTLTLTNLGGALQPQAYYRVAITP